MTTRRRRRGVDDQGKSTWVVSFRPNHIQEENSGDGPDERLPERLFATDRYQSRRLNVYSSLEFLVAVKDILRGTPEMDRILVSCFGKLFELPIRRCSYSSVMIHALLARQLVTKKRYIAWPVFGGNPLRFSMVEFGRVTGLLCGEFEEGYVVDMKLKYKEEDYAYWDKLFDGRRDITIPDVVQIVTEDLTISRSRRLNLCLIIIIDGVLIASTQPARPTLKHVKRWGRESFYWTVSDMIPPKRIMGVCDDPTREFCTKLRQKTKKMTALPLTLYGNDDQKIIDCQSLPQHTGLNLVDVLEAEHHPELRFCFVFVLIVVLFWWVQLTVQSMMEIGPDKPDGWGEWDDEIDDRRVKYMVRLIEDGHKFKKSMWRGGDAAEDLYGHEKRKAANKRKSAAAAEEEYLSDEDTEEHKDIPETPIVKDVGENEDVDEVDVGIGNENLPAESEDVEAEDEEDVEDSVDEDEEEDEQEKGSGEMDVEMEGMSSEEPPEVFAPLKEGDGVPLEWVDGWTTAKSGCVLYRVTTSKTFFGCIDGGASGKMAVGEAKDGANVAEDGDETESKESDGVIVKEHVAPSGDGGMGDCTTKVAQELSGLDKLVGAIVRGASGEVDVGHEANAIIKKVSTPVSGVGENGDEIKGLGKVDGVEDVADVGAVKASDGNEMITCSSDSSPCPRSEKHEPAETEANLASLLLAKEPFSIDQIVPAVEDTDFGYFEKVFLANPKVLHLGAGKYDLDNQFFHDLATPCKWVSTKHMKVLVDYVSEIHGALLKENRAIFVDPWFVDHLLGKARSFKVATYKGRVFSDPKLAGYLTKEGKKLGGDVDTVYGPIIWGTNHWVGLAINIRTWSVQVFDSDRSLRSMEEVMVIMSPIAQRTPYLVQKVCPAEFLLGHGLEPFVVERMEFVYQNRRSGDCGPMVVKFMELSSTGVEQPGVADLTNNAVGTEIRTVDFRLNKES
ncbi:hypothetical protein Bca52824_046632 [Brassica carinata]|uniref:Ubiquitin-like protease family profile domain-containing protein n=1 Tax=Brassica carinata TaxID=52824 RepID=A0A8X7RHI9_BRACI|nr:hypothetical protein Bca52824_046632 [Brassica carinata]